MMIVREEITTKPGQASKLSKLFRKLFGNDGNIRVLTDVVANYNTVVVETQVKDLADYQKMMDEYQSGERTPDTDPETAEAMSKYTEMYLTGRRSIYRIVE